MPYSSINTSKSGLTVCKVRKFSNNSLRHERSTVPVSRRTNCCRMTTSDSYRMPGRLGGGADIEEVEAKVEDLEAPTDSADTERHASVGEKHASITEKHLSISEKQPSISEKQPSISEKQPSISEKHPSISEKHPSVSSEKQPSISGKQPSISGEKQSSISGKQPSISGEKQPSVSSEKQPSISGEKHPSISGEKHPSISGEKHPSVSSEKQPSISAEKHPSVSSEKQPSISGEKHPSVSSEKQPSIVSEKHPSIISEKHPSIASEKHLSISEKRVSVDEKHPSFSEKHPSIASEKHGSVSEKSLSGQFQERLSEQHKSVDYTQQKKPSTISQLSKTSKAAEDDCETDYLIPPSGPCCTCLTSPTTGDRSVDELIEYVRHNIQEANKILTSLPDNFEQELKLLYADVLARVKQWIAMVQSKLATIENDIETLRKQLIARLCELAKKDREIADLKAKLAECMAAREALEKALADKTAELEAERAKHAAELERLKEARTSVVKDEETRTSRDDRPTARHAMANAFVQCTGRDKDRLKREAELEAELARLRKENERIVKERAEYESAIQRALLRGVSCLNVEALRVLRCPPIPCCSPCAPCPGAKSSQDNIVPCDGRAREKAPKTCGPGRRTCPARNGHDQVSTTVRRPCASPCCTGRYSNQKSPAENGMVFVLHQGDVGNLCEPDMPRCCGRVKRIDISPSSRESTVSCDAGSVDKNSSSHEKVCDSSRCKGNNNVQSNGYQKRPSDICFPGVSSREFIDDLVLSFCGTADNDTPPVCGEPIMKRIEIPPCPKFRF